MIAKISIVVAAVVLAVTLAFGCAPVEQEEVVVVKITGHMPVGHHDSIACERFIEEAEELSNGTLKFVHFPAGQLVMDMPAFEMCQAGGIEMAQLFVNRTVGLVPEVDLIWPFFDPEDWWARRMFDPESGGGLFYEVIRPKFEEFGLHIFGMGGHQYYPEHSVITTVPVYTLEDYKGLKIRTSGLAAGVIIDSWGARAVVMSSADVYMAIQRGTMDGANSGLTTFVSRKWFEVADYIQYHAWRCVSTLDMIANLDWWNGLSDFHRECINDAYRSSSIWCWETAIAQVEKDKKFLEDAGLELYEWPAALHDEMVATAMDALEKEIAPLVGEAMWNKHMAMWETTKTGTKTWREVLETCQP